jgi:DNA polymerase-1
MKKLEEEGATVLYHDVELPLSDVLFDMEQAGFKVDVNALNLAGEKYSAILKGLEEQIRLQADEPTLNVNSPKQLGEVLFEKLKLAKGKKTKHGYSTTAEILESLEDLHPIIPLILQYRRIQKLNSTYIEGLKPLIEKSTGLIHTSFNQTVTATGRLSSKEPNLQNIPVRDEEGKEIRKLFVPKSEDRIIIGADYSQIELRLLAAFSNCQSLIAAFSSGQDVHAQTAAKVFNVPLDGVTPQMRSSAKAVNFGIIYGISEYGLAKQLKIENSKAREYINSYFKEYPEVKKYMDDNVAFAKENGYAKTLLGRRRYIRELSSSNYNLRQFGERVAMNMPLQGSSADIIKLAMLGVAKRLKKENLKSELILQVHDELIVDAFISEKDAVIKILTEEMEGAVSLSVPLTVGKEIGKTWYDAK